MATETPSSAQPACTDNWQGPNTGVTNWSANASYWSSGFPTGSSIVCVSEAGTYTVQMTANTSVAQLEVGAATSGAQTVLVNATGGSVEFSSSGESYAENGGTLTLESGASGNAYLLGGGSAAVESGGAFTTEGSADTVYLYDALTNETGGSVTIGTSGTAATDQDNDTLTSNAGGFTVSSGTTLALTGGSSFTQSAGTLAVTGTMTENGGTFTQSGGAESGNPVDLTGGTLADSVGTGAFEFTGNGTLSGTIPSGQTVTDNATGGSVEVTLSGAVTVDGTLTAESGSGGNAYLLGSGGSVVVATGGAFTTEGSADTVYLYDPITNQSGGTVTIGSTSTDQDDGSLTSNAGSFTVSSGATLALSGGSSFTQSAGTLVVTGTFTESSGTFTQSGGAESGSPVDLTGGTLADSVGTGAFVFTGNGTLSGTVPSGQTVTDNATGGSVELTLSGAVTVDGTLTAESGTGGNAYVLGGTGSVVVASGGTFTTEGSADTVYLYDPITNQTGGKVTIGTSGTAVTDQDDGSLTSNAGSFTVSSGAILALSGGSSFTQSAGTLVVTGTFTESSGTFTQSGGAESGSPVDLTGGTLADSVGTGSFEFTGNGTLSGTIPSGQTVTNNATGGSVELSLSGAVTVDGTLTAESGSGGNAYVLGGGGSVVVASGGTFSTEGSADSVYLYDPITNQAGGTVTIGEANTDQNDGSATDNAGTLQVVNGGELALSGGSTLVNTGTLGVTVNGTAGTGGVNGAGITVTGSTLAVTTVGTPSVGTQFVPINGNGNAVTGTFSNFSFPPDDEYTVTYPTDEVEVTSANVFETTPTSFKPPAGAAYGPVQVGSISSAGPGTYSGTVNYGDGTGNQTATVNVTGTTGTVTAPSHTYATAGTYTVTMTVVNNNGGVLTAQTVSESVTTGPTITGLSKSSVAPKKKLNTTVSGIGFDGTGTAAGGFTTSDPTYVTVTKVTFKKASKKKAASYKVHLSVAEGAPAGPVTLTLTQTGGTDPGTATATFTIT